MSACYAIIMAGGGGTRLWPLSRRERPKQALALFNEQTLFQNTLARLWGAFSPPQVLVVTVEEQQPLLAQQAPALPPENWLVEPLPRGTLAAAALAWLALTTRNVHDALMVLLPSDHYIANPALLQKLLRAACQVAQQGHIVALGITPHYPATGYGYIQQGEPLGTFEGFPAYRVQRFREKPSLEEAQRLLAMGGHTWNAGIFIWHQPVFWEELQRHMPTMARELQRLLDQDLTPQDLNPKALRKVWERLPEETIDYGIMEKTQRAAVLPAPVELGWNDIGSWDAVFELLAQEQERDTVIVGAGDRVVLDSANLLVYLEDRPRVVASIEVQDLVLVLTQDALLLCRRGATQRVREVVRALQQRAHPSV